MKKFFVKYFICTFFYFGCTSNDTAIKALQQKVDSLQTEINNSYKPGLGDFMISIQLHHQKLWFAGIHENWSLADFEMHEIAEALADIKTYNNDRPEATKVVMLNQPLDDVENAIKEKNITSFRNSFLLLTNTCNACHQAVNFSFNVVKVPDTSSFYNQSFEKK